MLVVDAGPLNAAAAARDRHHAECVDLLSREPGPLLVPARRWRTCWAIVALAERHGADRIATLDHRHLATVRPRHIAGFALVP